MVGSLCTNSSPFRKNKQDQNNLSFRGKPASRSFSCKCFCSLVTNEPIISEAQEHQKKKPFSILPASEMQQMSSLLKRSYQIQGDNPWWHLPAVLALRLQKLSTHKSFKKNKKSQDFDKGKSQEQCFTVCPSMETSLFCHWLQVSWHQAFELKAARGSSHQALTHDQCTEKTFLCLPLQSCSTQISSSFGAACCCCSFYFKPVAESQRSPLSLSWK